MGVNDRPELPDLFELWERNVHNGIHCLELGEVLRYHKGPPPTVDVQLSARPLLNTGDRYDRPVISRVPVVFPSFGPIVIRAVPERGDGLMCHVFDREIATWLRGNGGTYNPDTRRTHNLNDIVAVPSMRRNRKQPRTTDNARELFIGHESGQGTYLKLNVQTGAVSVVADTSVRLGSELATLGVARQTDPIAINAADVANLNAALVKLNALPPVTAFPPVSGTGTIVSGSAKVRSE